MPRPHLSLLLLLALLLSGCEGGGHFALAPLFQSHMVLQQRAVTRFHGSADPGSHIAIEADWGFGCTCRADDEGHWEARVTAPEGGSRPRTITFRCGPETHVIDDVLIGEVWVAAGQAPMQMPLTGYAADSVDGGLRLLAEPPDSLTRFFVAVQQTDCHPLTRLYGSWGVARDKVGAVPIGFAQALRDSLRLPVGIVQTTYGGAPLRSWTCESMQADDSLSRLQLERLRKQQTLAERYDKMLASYPSLSVYDQWGHDLLPDVTVGDAQMSLSMHDVSAWPTLRVPGYWQGPLRYFTGVLWFIRQVEIPPPWVGRELLLHLGSIDDRDRTYVNTTDVGGFTQGGQYNTDRLYRVSAQTVSSRKVVVAVRVTNEFAGGGILGPGMRGPITLEPADSTLRGEPLVLDGDWHYCIAAQFRLDRLHLFGLQRGGFPVDGFEPFTPDHRLPAMLFNGMMHPLRGLAVAGVIAHYGEADMVTASDSAAMADYIPRVVDCYRALLGRDATVLFAQSHARAFNDVDTLPAAAARVRLDILRGAQARPNTGVISTLDLSLTTTNRPPFRLQEGARFARVALRLHYHHRQCLAAGPMPQRAQAFGDVVEVAFVPSTSPGLRLDQSRPSQVELAGPDGHWHQAHTWLDHGCLHAFSYMVPEPTKLRYAARNWAWATLWNEQLPSPTFQIDVQKGLMAERQ